jgi:hypothetical protein
VDEERGLAGHGVQTNHVPEQPGLHGACIAVTWKTGYAGVVVAFCNFAGLVDGAVLAVDEVVEVRDVESSTFINTDSEEWRGSLTAHS